MPSFIGAKNGITACLPVFADTIRIPPRLNSTRRPASSAFRMASAIQASKKALRSTMATKIRTLADAEVQQQSEAVLRHLLDFPTFRKSRSVACFLGMKGEVDTYGIAGEILSSGKVLYIPKITDTKESKMDMLRVYNQEDLEGLSSGTWGIKEPGPTWEGRRRASALTDDSEEIDLILVPGVAFDRELSRIGHGKGYYDSFINRYSERSARLDFSRPLLCALALREQIVPAGRIPMAEHDRKMDAIMTADGLIPSSSM